jgi:GTP cyclohydrolase I
MQERLTSQVADTIMEGLTPDGVAVVIEAEHLCMTMRGWRKPNGITSAMRGQFRQSSVTRGVPLAKVAGR